MQFSMYKGQGKRGGAGAGTSTPFYIVWGKQWGGDFVWVTLLSGTGLGQARAGEPVGFSAGTYSSL